ncbi:hypothetical protein [Kibdelosporangium philippinense]|uniref:hypothetical protein n=1 Tax=Kibdelosporangium philippinense TaxID=211113 RepID=UPI00362129D5
MPISRERSDRQLAEGQRREAPAAVQDNVRHRPEQNQVPLAGLRHQLWDHHIEDCTQLTFARPGHGRVAWPRPNIQPV